MQVTVYSLTGEEKGKIELSENIFNIEVNENVLYEYVKEFLNNQRQGTAKTKTRGEVSGGGRKPWRQKGTGRARAGSIRSPLWVGGGTTFGPQPKNWYYTINKKVKRIALKSSLTLKAKENKILIIENVDMEKPKTKVFADLAKKLQIAESDKKLFVSEKYNKNFYNSVRNLEGSIIIMSGEINPYFVLNSDYVIFTENGLKKLEEVFGL